MEVLVNNKLYAVQPGTTIAALLQFIQLSAQGIAVAVNNEVIPRAAWDTAAVAAADNITIIRATQGG